MGAVPVIWSWNEGAAVTEMDATTDSTSTEVFELLTTNTVGLFRSQSRGYDKENSLMLTALTLPLMTTTVPLQP